MSEKSFKCFVCLALVKAGMVCYFVVNWQVIFIFFMDSLKQLGFVLELYLVGMRIAKLSSIVFIMEIMFLILHH